MRLCRLDLQIVPQTDASARCTLIIVDAYQPLNQPAMQLNQPTQWTVALIMVHGFILKILLHQIVEKMKSGSF